MPSILILNTALERACAMVWRDTGTVVRHARETRQSAQTILQLAREALDESEVRRADAVAVVAGPGSFTGTRIGVAAAQGLCAAWDAPALPMSTLELSATAVCRQVEADTYLVGLKARADEIYFGCYQPAGNALELRGAEQAGALSQLRMESIGEGGSLAVGDGWPEAGEIESHFGIRLRSGPLAVAIEEIDLVTLARNLWERGEFTSADLLRPNYVNETPQYREQSDRG